MLNEDNVRASCPTAPTPSAGQASERASTELINEPQRKQQQAADSVGSETTTRPKMPINCQQMAGTTTTATTPSGNYNSSGFCQSCVVAHWPVKLKIVGPITTRHQCRDRAGRATGLKVLRSGVVAAARQSSRSTSPNDLSVSRPAQGYQQQQQQQQQQQKQPCKCSIVVVNDELEEPNRCCASQQLYNSSQLLIGWQQHHQLSGSQTGAACQWGNRVNCSRSMPSSRSMSLTHEYAGNCAGSGGGGLQLGPMQSHQTAAPFQQALFQHPDMMRAVSPAGSATGHELAGGNEESRRSSYGEPLGGGSQFCQSKPMTTATKTTIRAKSPSETGKRSGGACSAAGSRRASGNKLAEDDEDRLKREGEDEFDCNPLGRAPTRFKANSISSCVRLLASNSPSLSTAATITNHLNNPQQPQATTPRSCLLCDLRRHLTVVAQQQQAQLEQQQPPSKDYLKPGDYAASSSFNRLFARSPDSKPPTRRHSWICR